jgi:hypothetical protein
MDKQKILEWANKLIREYQDSAETVIAEFSGTPEKEIEENDRYCDELRNEIMKLLEM